MALSNIQDIVDAHLNGYQFQTAWRKFSSAGTPSALGTWADLSMVSGSPSPQYYAATPLNSVVLSQSEDGGILHGQPVSPKKKYLRKILFMNSGTAQAQFMLCDYLMFYSFIDESTLDLQNLTNSVSLTRYTNGDNVKIMAVTVGARTGNQTFRLTYTNSNGVSGRVTPLARYTTTGNSYSSIANSGSGANVSSPFIALQDGDTGVRSIQSFQMVSGTDVGLTALVLVKPLCTFQIVEQTAPSEVDCLQSFGVMPEIVDNAYLNVIVQSAVNLGSQSLFGFNTYIWG
jgi:hypothetical protein